jgi:hypothetical protein
MPNKKMCLYRSEFLCLFNDIIPSDKKYLLDAVRKSMYNGKKKLSDNLKMELMAICKKKLYMKLYIRYLAIVEGPRTLEGFTEYDCDDYYIGEFEPGPYYRLFIDGRVYELGMRPEKEKLKIKPRYSTMEFEEKHERVINAMALV